MFETSLTQTAAAIAFFVCAIALWRGLWPERAAAVVIMIGWMASDVVQVIQTVDPEWGIFWVDVVVLAIFLTLLMRSGRLWLAAASAFQLLAVASHVAMLIDHRIVMNTYLIALTIWSFAIIAALLVGALTARPSRRRREAGPADDVPVSPVRAPGRLHRDDGRA